MYIKLDMPDSDKYDVIDLNTGVRIPGVQEANDETGDFSIIMKDTFTDDWIVKNTIAANESELVVFHFKGNIKIIKKGE